MLDATSLDAQLATASHDERRTLVVGAGMAGLTAAQLLRRRGRHPVLVDRSADGGHPGYMLALMPMVDAAIADLGVRDAYLEASEPLERYRFHSHTGPVQRLDPLGGMMARYGDYRGIARGELVEVLSRGGAPVTFGTTVAELDEAADGVRVVLDTPHGRREAEFDLVVIADGIHSTTRSLVLGDEHVQSEDTGWGGWVVWIDADDESDLADEIWGAGFFLGVYPVKRRLGAFFGGPRAETRDVGAFVESVRDRLREIPPRFERVLDTVVRDPDPYYWSLVDGRATRWTTSRTVLLGDAAAGFLPTAGVGAGMAIESAWALVRELESADAGTLAAALAAYERAQRPRVETAQDASRSLGRLMLRRSRVLAVLRDLVMRVVSVDAALRPIERLLADAPR